MKSKTIFVIGAILMLSGLTGCLPAAAVMALGTAASAASIAKDMFDIDVSIHSLFDQEKPAQPIPPMQLLAHPEYVIVSPPPPPPQQPHHH